MGYIGCIGFPLLILLGMIYPIGVTQLKCKRLEPTQVSCKKQQSKFFGFLQQSPIKLNQVKSAKFKSQQVNNNGKSNIDNWVVLITRNGEVTLAEDFVYINGVKGSAEEMKRIENQVNNFIQSNQSSLLIKRDLRWNFAQSLFWIGFISIPLFIGIMIFFFVVRSEVIIFDKNGGHFIREQKTLFFKHRQYYPLAEITEIEIETTTDKDINLFHELIVLPKSIYGRVLLDTKLEEMKSIQNTIHEFLKL